MAAAVASVSLACSAPERQPAAARGGTLPPPTTSVGGQPEPPIRATFYYPWFPDAWRQKGRDPFTNYRPAAGLYDSSARGVIKRHIAGMGYGNIDAGIVSWWGRGSRTDKRFPLLLEAAAGTPVRWAVYHEPEGQGDPSADELAADLAYISDRYARDPAYLRVEGRFVVFAYAQAGDDCAMAERWRQANRLRAYVVLKVFPGYRACASQPDGWHQYAPANPVEDQEPWSFSVSPGFWKAGEEPRLERLAARWQADVRAMAASPATFHLIATWNEWGEGTAVEEADEWASASGWGLYLDTLHAVP